MLKELSIRYNRPIFIAETGAESDNRQPWVNYICSEVYNAICQGLPINGICLYPIIDYPGWDDNRHCETGLLGLVDPLTGYRTIFEPLAQEIKLQHPRFTNINNLSTMPNIPPSINESNTITYNNL